MKSSIRRPVSVAPKEISPSQDLDRPNSSSSGNVLSQKLKHLRRDAKLTLQQLGERCGISSSTLSKIEAGRLSPTYEKIAALARGLDVEVGELFNTEQPIGPTGRRSVTRRGEGVLHATEQYNYEVLCADLAHKQFVPLVTTIKAQSVKSFPALLRHDGEEFIYVLCGEVMIHTDFYQPIVLSEGDSCYFDSAMGHACISSGNEEAKVLWVCSNPKLPST
jgi:transcriptional regulator with XRE-family HTH domain